VKKDFSILTYCTPITYRRKRVFNSNYVVKTFLFLQTKHGSQICASGGKNKTGSIKQKILLTTLQKQYTKVKPTKKWTNRLKKPQKIFLEKPEGCGENRNIILKTRERKKIENILIHFSHLNIG